MNKQPFNKNVAQEFLYRHGKYAMDKAEADKATPAEVRKAGVKAFGKRMLAATAFSTALIAATSGGSSARNKPIIVEHTIKEGDTGDKLALESAAPGSEYRDNSDNILKTQTGDNDRILEPGEETVKIVVEPGSTMWNEIHGQSHQAKN